MILGQLVVKVNPNGSSNMKEAIRKEIWTLDKELEVIESLDVNSEQKFLCVDNNGVMRHVTFGDVLFVRYVNPLTAEYTKQPSSLFGRTTMTSEEYDKINSDVISNVQDVLQRSNGDTSGTPEKKTK